MKVFPVLLATLLLAYLTSCDKKAPTLLTYDEASSISLDTSKTLHGTQLFFIKDNERYTTIKSISIQNGESKILSSTELNDSNISPETAICLRFYPATLKDLNTWSVVLHSPSTRENAYTAEFPKDRKATYPSISRNCSLDKNVEILHYFTLMPIGEYYDHTQPDQYFSCTNLRELEAFSKTMPRDQIIVLTLE
ncbi:hypothetical protein Rhal01_02220 [Rubritalea halochordaticola]|uniref:Lipoprotein n=1 Tax=Rubritalea halochordaticola TaxID=714537 RepID=A0ABP9V356_9BACT